MVFELIDLKIPFDTDVTFISASTHQNRIKKLLLHEMVDNRKIHYSGKLKRKSIPKILCDLIDRLVFF